MKTREMQLLIVLVIFILFAFVFGWITRTDALLCLIFITCSYMLRILCEILENIKSKQN
jgi:ABC-type phosphate/phosphonate transport system permease subunit